MLPKKNMIAMLAFLLPVLCCLIGVGAFVLATTSVSDPNQPPDPPVTAEGLQTELAKLNERIIALRAELEAAGERGALAQKVKELIDALELGAASTMQELAGLATAVAVIERLLHEINSAGAPEQGQGDAQPAPSPGRNVVSAPPAIPLLAAGLASGTQI